MSAIKIRMAEDGPEFSRIVLGFWKAHNWGYSAQELLTLLKQSIDAGVTTFDHADIYGSFSNEELFGDALKLDPSLRKNIQVITKCDIKFPAANRPEYKTHHYDTSQEHIINSVENSLRNFNTDFIDLLLIHRPDPLMDAVEVADAFNRLREAGKVLYFGVSNFLPHQFDLLQSRVFFPLMTNQVKFSVLHLDPLDDGTADQCQQLRISPMAYSPLDEGRIFTDNSEKTRNVRNELSKTADEFNVGIDQIALAWLMKHPAGFVPVIGTGKIDRIKAAVNSIKIPLSRDEWFNVWKASKGHGLP